MQAAGVPVLPGETVEPDSRLHELAHQIGLPLIVKASAGGGGKGMRIVRGIDELERAVAAAKREAQSAFGDDGLFLERYMEAARHVEIQIFGDHRDCSVQRRHQKVIEESPSPALDDALRAKMSEAAVTAGRQLGYVGAGTVEFLLAPGGEFFFLEVNTRLQVEHPVTELVTGLDLVALQIRVAEGHPLPQEARHATLTGHAVEARLYAEDPEQGFLPVTGELERFGLPTTVRVDAGVAHGSEVTAYYDPMLAKVIAHAPSREEATRRLADALRRARIHGLKTNRDFLVRVLTHPEFALGAADTHFLERHDLGALGAPLLDPEAESHHAAAGVFAMQAARRDAATTLPTLPSGWRNNPSQLQQSTLAGAHGSWTVGYRFDHNDRLLEISIGDRVVGDPRLHRCSADEVELELDGLRLLYRVSRGRDGALYVNSALGQASLSEVPRFPRPEQQAVPGSLTSPMPGSVLRLMVREGSRVKKGDPLLVVEAMKMEHEIMAPTAGVLAQLLVGEGTHVEAGATLAVITEDG